MRGVIGRGGGGRRGELPILKHKGLLYLFKFEGVVSNPDTNPNLNPNPNLKPSPNPNLTLF